jgi:hypothetical protein
VGGYRFILNRARQRRVSPFNRKDNAMASERRDQIVVRPWGLGRASSNLCDQASGPLAATVDVQRRSFRPLSDRRSSLRAHSYVWFGSGTVLRFAAMSGGSMTDTGPSCLNGSCAPLSRHSVDLLQRRQSTHTCRSNPRKADARGRGSGRSSPRHVKRNVRWCSEERPPELVPSGHYCPSI